MNIDRGTIAFEKIEHRGHAAFSQGTFGNGGANLFVDAGGAVRRIMDNDLNGDGLFDIVLPNSHGYIERGPTYLYSRRSGDWSKRELPHDSGWMPRIADLDGDGYPDLIIANGENGVSSELTSYVYWGGPQGLTGEWTAFDTFGAYDAAVARIGGFALPVLVFTTAWLDHHNAGVPLRQKIYVQTAPRQFRDATDEFALASLALTAPLWSAPVITAPVVDEPLGARYISASATI